MNNSRTNCHDMWSCFDLKAEHYHIVCELCLVAFAFLECTVNSLIRLSCPVSTSVLIYQQKIDLG